MGWDVLRQASCTYAELIFLGAEVTDFDLLIDRM